MATRYISSQNFLSSPTITNHSSSNIPVIISIPYFGNSTNQIRKLFIVQNSDSSDASIETATATTNEVSSVELPPGPPSIISALNVEKALLGIGAGATYSRMIPSVKKRYDYGVMIFILTFNLVVVSGVRADKIMKLAGERLSTIGMGFAVCIFTSFIYPIWASDELHSSTASKFDKLASSIQGCLEEYFKIADDKEKQPTIDVSGCKSVLHSKSSDESLSNFAKWEPWHGKFGFFYPWEKYLQIGDVLRELAASVLSFKGCVQSLRQPSPIQRDSIKEPCETIGLSIAWILKEVGESIRDMKICRTKVLISPRTQCMIQELRLLVKTAENSTDNLGLASFIFHLLELVEKIEMVAIKVEELGEIARFHYKKVDV